MNTSIKYALGLGILVLVGAGLVMMFESKKSVPQVNSFSWQFADPTQMKYIGAQDWPPQIQTIAEPFACNGAGNETDRAGGTSLKTINERAFCVTVVSDGAAGSVYRQYAYATAVGQGTEIATFTLRFPQCDNYDEPNRSACHAEQDGFSADALIQ